MQGVTKYGVAPLVRQTTACPWLTKQYCIMYCTIALYTCLPILPFISCVSTLYFLHTCNLYRISIVLSFHRRSGAAGQRRLVHSCTHHLSACSTSGPSCWATMAPGGPQGPQGTAPSSHSCSARSGNQWQCKRLTTGVACRGRTTGHTPVAHREGSKEATAGGTVVCQTAVQVSGKRRVCVR